MFALVSLPCVLYQTIEPQLSTLAMTALLQLGPTRVMVGVLKHYIGPGGGEARNGSFHLLALPRLRLQNQEPPVVPWLREVFLQALHVSPSPWIVTWNKIFERVIARIGLIARGPEFPQCIHCSQTSPTTLTSCQAVNRRGLSQ